MRVLLALLFAPFLTACANSLLIDKQVDVARPPEDMFTCAPEPAAPGEGMLDPTFSAWIAQALAAGRDCRKSLAEVKGWIDGYSPAPQEKPVEKPWWRVW